MKVRELEEAVRAIVQGSPNSSPLAALAGNAQGLDLPSEFQAAARALLHRTERSPDKSAQEEGEHVPWF